MKLFLREHLVLIFVQSVQFTLTISLFWLAGFRDLTLALYSLLIGFFFLFSYLIYQYVRRRAFYKRLSKPPASIEDALAKEGDTPIDRALHRLLKSNYRLYQHEMVEMAKNREEHFVFMDLWVHQMKTPLSVIDLIARDLDEPHSASIRDENEKLKEGLNTVLYMSRLRAITKDFQIKQLLLPNIVQQVNQENKRLFIRNRVYPKMTVEDKALHVESDEKWLFFIISQLIHNAVKYSAGKSEKVMIRLYHRRNFPVLEIQDFGVGIPAADVQRIYDAFFTGENGRTFKASTGVGLYVTKEVADYLGHGLEVESIQGEGTTFRILFSK